MSVLMIFRIALKALGRNKMRTALTMLGMIIGVAAVITMVALGTGAQSSIDAQIQTAGTNMIMVMRRQLHAGRRAPGPGQRQHARRPTTPRRSRSVPGVQYAAAGVRTRAARSSPAIRTGTRRCRAPTSTSRSSARGRSTYGRVLHAAGRHDGGEGRRARQRSSAISCSAPDVDPVGQVIRIQQPAVHGRRRDGEQGPVGHRPGPGRSRLRAVHDGDEEAARHHLHPAASPSRPHRPARCSTVADRIAALLRVRHKIQPGDPDDFMVRTIEEMASVRKEATQTMTALLASIAGVSLLVGGIGIMNIMLVSVTERTREIGLRMAIGARGRDVLLQFLVEAVVLSLVGGGIGIALGFGLAQGVTLWQGWPTAVSRERGRGGVRLRRGDRRVLRVLSGAEGRRARSDRSAALRVIRPTSNQVPRGCRAGSPVYWKARVVIFSCVPHIRWSSALVALGPLTLRRLLGRRGVQRSPPAAGRPGRRAGRRCR